MPGYQKKNGFTNIAFLYNEGLLKIVSRRVIMDFFTVKDLDQNSSLNHPMRPDNDWVHFTKIKQFKKRKLIKKCQY